MMCQILHCCHLHHLDDYFHSCHYHQNDCHFENAAFALKNIGDIAPPVQTEYGIHIIKLINKTSDTKEKKEEAGLKVIAVIKDSPAFKSGIQKGDVILVLNDVNTESPEEFSKAWFILEYLRSEIKF